MAIVWIAYLILPGIIANMSPVLFSKVNFLDYPVDFGKLIGGKRILGDNKTFRGLFFGVLFAVVTAFIMVWIPVNTIYKISFSNFFIVGLLSGFGALVGDMIESFIKRMLNIAPGKALIPFDEIDHILGALLSLSILFTIPLVPAVWVVVFAIPIHIIINMVGFKLKLRKNRL